MALQPIKVKKTLKYALVAGDSSNLDES